MKAVADLRAQEIKLEAEAKEANEFLGGLIPQTVKELGGILGDNIRLLRWKNQINIIKKAKKYIEENNLTAEGIDLKILAPLLENSSLEEDASLQEKWAAMLANAASGRESVKPMFPEILKELSSIEVQILDRIYNEYSVSKQKGENVQFDKQKIREFFSINQVEIDLIIDNLFRLNLCTAPGASGIQFGGYPVAIRTTEIFELTPLGFYFVSACNIRS